MSHACSIGSTTFPHVEPPNGTMPSTMPARAGDRRPCLWLLVLILKRQGTMEPAPKTRVVTALTAFHDYWNQLEPAGTTGSLCQTSISERGQASLPYRLVVGKQIYLIKCICRLLRKARTEMKSSVFILTTNYPMEVQNV